VPAVLMKMCCMQAPMVPVDDVFKTFTPAASNDYPMEMNPW
jgi:hypothetical protein